MAERSSDQFLEAHNFCITNPKGEIFVSGGDGSSYVLFPKGEGHVNSYSQ